MHTSVWCHLTIAQAASPRPEIVHRVHTTLDRDPEGVPALCTQITLDYRFKGRRLKSGTVSATEASGCEHREKFDPAISETWFIARILQSAGAEEEELYFAAPRGEKEFTFAVELNPLAKPLDALVYIASYPDLIESFGTDIDAARRHFRDYGRIENRLSTFDAPCYVASHPDLHPMWPNHSAACEHFILHGFREHRSIYFDPYIYLAANPDLISGLEAEPSLIVDHYIRRGLAEGRECHPLRWRDYLNRYRGIDHITDSEHAVAKHFVLHGFQEGRQLQRA